MNRPFRLSLLSALIAFAATAPACSKKKAPPPGVSHYVLALDWVPEPEFGGFYAARETGAFQRQRMDVDIRGGGAGVPVVQMVASGKADIGVVGADEVLSGRTHGADVLAVFATFQTSPQAIMVHAARGYKSLGEALRSGTLAIEPGLPYAAFLKKKYGAFGARVVPYDGGVARFMVEPDFAQQCYVTAEPIAAKRKGGDPQTFLVADEGFNPYTGVVIVNGKLSREHPEMVPALMNALREGWSAYLDDPAATQATNAVIARLNPTMDAETFAAAAAAERPLIEAEGPGAIGLMTRDRWNTLAKQLVDIGAIASVPSAGDYLPPESEGGPLPAGSVPRPDGIRLDEILAGNHRAPADAGGKPPPGEGVIVPGKPLPPGTGLLPGDERGRIPVPGEDAPPPPPPPDAAPPPP
jgi:NitT/TauT family transport system substrate-binding protein